MTDEQIFDQVIRLERRERDGFLSEVCDDQGQLGRVEALLEAHEQSDSLLDTEAMAPLADTAVERPIHKTIGDFEILREIGRGGMGVVYEARQKSLKRKVALKLLSSGLGLSSKAILRFRREAEAAGKLHHTNIVPIYTTGEDRGVHFYAMELIDGPSLDAVIRDLKSEDDCDQLPDWVRVTALYEAASSNAPRTEVTIGQGGSADVSRLASSSMQAGSAYFDQVASMMAEVADALDHAHEHGVIHRDIKPSNLLLAPDGRLSVNDFGLARMLEQPGMTMSGEFVGSPLYMSPEQISAGRAPLDHRTDIYSLGVTLYEMLTLEPVFSGDRRDEVIAQILHKDPVPPRRLNRLIPVDLETICLKSIERDPDRRYQTAGQLAMDLRRYVERHAISARRIGPIGILIKKARRQPGAAAFFALLFLVVFVSPLAIWRVSQVQKQKDLIDSQEEVAAALLRGDFRTAERCLQDAIELGATDSWRLFTRGHIELLQGDFAQSAELLEIALELEPESTAVKSLLAICKLWGGDDDAYGRHMNELENVEPTEFEDLLFLGYASTWRHPYRSLELLRKAERQNSNHPMVRLWRAMAYRWCAMDCADSQKALEYAEKGLEDLRVARAMHEESSLAAAECVLSNFVARNARLDLAEEHSSKSDSHLESAASHERAAISAANLLQSFPDGLDVQFGLAIQVQQTDNKEVLRQLVSKLEESTNVNPYVAGYVGMLYFALGEFKQAANWIDQTSGRQGELTRFLKYLVLLSDPAEKANRPALREEFKRYVNAMIDAGDHGYLEFDWSLLVLLHESKLAARTIKFASESPETLFAPDSLYEHLMQGGPGLVNLLSRYELVCCAVSCSFEFGVS